MAKNWLKSIRSWIHSAASQFTRAGWNNPKNCLERGPILSAYSCTVLFSRAKEVPTGTEVFLQTLKYLKS